MKKKKDGKQIERLEEGKKEKSGKLALLVNVV